VFRESFVFLSVAFEDFFLSPFHSAIDILGHLLAEIIALNHEEVLTVPDVLGISSVEITLAERQIMNGIQNVGFTHSVSPDQTVDLGAEFHPGLLVILKINQREAFQIHGGISRFDVKLIKNPDSAGVF
jgi:hypothetical protein